MKLHLQFISFFAFSTLKLNTNINCLFSAPKKETSQCYASLQAMSIGTKYVANLQLGVECYIGIEVV